MTLTLFITLLTIFAAVTSLITEAIKKALDERGMKYASNILACIVACIVGVCGTAVCYILFDILFTAENIVCIFLMGLCTSVGAMVGYDKVMQTISQIKIVKN